MKSSSSDSDSSERAKNVSQLLVKTRGEQQEIDESYAYKRKLGDLIFDAAFEGGNLGYIEKIDEFNYDLMIRPDVVNPRYRQWFNFSVSNQRLNQCVIFNIVNLSDSLPLLHEGLTPVVRSKQRPDWRRLHEDQVFYYKSENHGHRCVLSIAFRFDTLDNQHQFALFYPYTQSDLIRFISRWVVELKRRERVLPPVVGVGRVEHNGNMRGKTPDECYSRIKLNTQPKRSHSSLANYDEQKHRNQIGIDFRVETLTTSILSKPIHSLSIEAKHKPMSRRVGPRVVIISRLGGNSDSVASYVCQGIIDFILSEDAISDAAREFIGFNVFPLVDPDSISVGNSKSLILGQPSMTNKTAEANRKVYSNFDSVRRSVDSICKNAIGERVLVLQLSVDPNIIGSRVRGRHFADSLRMERHMSFPRLLSSYAEHFYPGNCIFSRRGDGKMAPKSGGFLDHLMAEHRNVDHYKFEISPFAAHHRSLVSNKYDEFHQMDYIATGKAIVYALLESLRPKNSKLFPQSVACMLKSFLPGSEDIDDLVLNTKNV